MFFLTFIRGNQYIVFKCFPIYLLSYLFCWRVLDLGPMAIPVELKVLLQQVSRTRRYQCLTSCHDSSIVGHHNEESRIQYIIPSTYLNKFKVVRCVPLWGLFDSKWKVLIIANWSEFTAAVNTRTQLQYCIVVDSTGVYTILFVHTCHRIPPVCLN